MFKYETIDDLVSYAKEAEGKKLKEIDNKDMFKSKNVKGKVGTIIEESYFGYPSNSAAEADFADVGVELKTTGIIRQKSGKLAAKERLVLNIINYETEAFKDFCTSSFWLKNNKLLIFFYSYVRNEENKPDYPNFEIIKTVLHEFNDTDLELIKKDWETINLKIKLGLAHELSEGDTNILGACTKGASAKSVRKQPFSDIEAKQRAYSLKQGYMSTLVRQYIDNEKLISFTSANELEGITFEKLLHNYFDKYINWSTESIAKDLNVELSNAKNKNALLISDILGITGTNLNNIEEFSKLNIKFKTITYTNTGRLPESMSFENLNFEEIYKEDFDHSSLKEQMESIKWLFVVFQKNENNETIFKGVKLWHVPENIIENEIRNLYDNIKETMINKSVVTYDKNGKETLNLPKSRFNGVCHVRPKGANRAKSMITLPNGERIPNQCFWFNAKFIRGITKEIIEK